MKLIIRLLTLLVVCFSGGFSAVWAQDEATVQDLTLDWADRLNPVGVYNNSNYVSGRYLIPSASGTTVHLAPIDTRELEQLMFQWTAGNPADTTASIGAALSFFGSASAADEEIGDATYLLTDTDISRLPILFADVEKGVLIDSSTAYISKRVILSSTPGLQYVDTFGIAWVKPTIASKTVGAATMNLFYCGKKK